MLLKRLYQKDKDGNLVSRTPIGVRVLSLGASPDQHFTPELVIQGSTQGWVKLGQDTLTIAAENGDVVYKIKRIPGHYCCHCGSALENSAAGKTHVERRHAGVKSPDPNNPAGYERINYYDCTEVNPRTKEKGKSWLTKFLTSR